MGVCLMFDRDVVLSDLVDLLEVNSPTGYTRDAINYLVDEISPLGFDMEVSPKGNLIVSVEGDNRSITRGLSGHVDTLGLMVRSINGDGTLALTTLGGPLTPTLDGEYCEVINRDDRTYTVTILSKSLSIHVYKDVSTIERDIVNLVF